MRIRRYYRKGVKYDYTISDAFFEEMISKYGIDRAMKIDNASHDIVLESAEEELSWFNDCCNRVISNTRWYLDNIDRIPTFRINYSRIFPEKQKDL